MHGEESGTISGERYVTGLIGLDLGINASGPKMPIHQTVFDHVGFIVGVDEIGPNSVTPITFVKTLLVYDVDCCLLKMPADKKAGNTNDRDENDRENSKKFHEMCLSWGLD